MPEEVRCWIVAIEAYGAGKATPAPDELDVQAAVGARALDLAKMLVVRGVNPGSIFLSVSLRDGAAYATKLADLQASGVEVGGATQADAQNVLPKLRGKGALLIYWVGHGIMEADRRLLLTADSQRAGDLRAIDVDSLLLHLRSSNYPALQMGFLDCCAQIVSRANTLELAGEGKGRNDQFFYYAASAGEVAAADTTRPGFSSTVIAALEKSAVPPVPKAFFPELTRQLWQLEGPLRPVLQWTEGSGDRWSSTGLRAKEEALLDEARRAELSYSEFDHLYQEARKLDVAAQDLSDAVVRNDVPGLVEQLRTRHGRKAAAAVLLERSWERVQLVREFAPRCQRLNLLWRAWLAMADEVGRAGHLGDAERIEDLPALLLYTLDQGRENGLRSFLMLLLLAMRRARALNLKGAEDLALAMRRHRDLGHLYDSVEKELPEEFQRIFLLLVLKVEEQTREVSVDEGWLYANKESPPLREQAGSARTAAEQANSMIENVLQRYPDRSLVVELVAPIEALCAPCELLEIADAENATRFWLEAEHATTVRWQERMKGTDRYRPGTWRQTSVQARGLAQAAMGCAWLKAGAEWKQRGAAAVIGIDFPGPSPRDPRRNRPEFLEILLSGHPYMCWPRDTVAARQKFQNAASKLIKAHKLDKLPQALRDAKRQRTHVLRNMVLFIDEPERNPFTQQFSNLP